MKLQSIDARPQEHQDDCTACSNCSASDRSSTSDLDGGTPSTESLLPGVPSVAEVLAYNNPDVVDRIERDHGVSAEDAESIFRDTVRFLYLAGATDAKYLAPTKAIDRGWHSFLLFTRDYAEFCDGYFRRFIHHLPRRRNDPAPKVNQLALTFELARRVFGPALSANWSYDVAAGDCQKCTSQCSPDSGGGGSECTPDHD